MRELSIIIPVYNEGGNFGKLWDQLLRTVQLPFQAYVIFDFEEDDTLPLARSIVAAGEQRLHLVRNPARGVVSAILTGFADAADGPVVVVMADLSDDLAKLEPMLELYERGFDVVAGSRYMKGGKMVGGPFFKQLLSRLAGISLFWLRGLPTHDATNAFKIYDRAMVRSFNIQSTGGFELNLELTAKAFVSGYRIAEVPATWWDRTSGESRFKLLRWLPLYLRWYFYCFQPKSAGVRSGAKPVSDGLNVSPRKLP